MRAQTTTLPKIDQTPEKWYLVDAEGQIVGRVAARVASLVRGKLSPSYTPHLNLKIHVVIINADKAIFTGNKMQQKSYYHHSGWRTGLKSITAEKLFIKDPADVLRKAIHGMLPKNTLGRSLNKNIRIYAGTEHPHQAQQPEVLAIKTRQTLSSK
ncbi:MAG: large subunit ribosomal protein [Candidatus Sumerlaeota bacterium]|nr:large subunit ribosomal protein [Candidatus Sumerlaeota bacterium]